jgi:hypothetical protein
MDLLLYPCESSPRLIHPGGRPGDTGASHPQCLQGELRQRIGCRDSRPFFLLIDGKRHLTVISVGSSYKVYDETYGITSGSPSLVLLAFDITFTVGRIVHLQLIVTDTE